MTGLAKLAAIACVAVACGRSSQPAAPPGPCEALQRSRAQLVAAANEDLDTFAWTKAQPAARKREAAEASVTAILAACVDDHWSPQAIDCILAESQAGDPAPCKADDHKRVSASFARAQDAALVRIFGPKPPAGGDPLEEYARQRAAEPPPQRP